MLTVMAPICCSSGTSGADFQFVQGDDWAGVVSVSDNGNSVDLTGYTASAQIRRDVADNADVAAEITTEIDLPDTIVLSLLHNQTVNLSGNYVWDLELVAPDATIQTILSGKVVVTPEVTREASDPQPSALRSVNGKR